MISLDLLALLPLPLIVAVIVYALWIKRQADKKHQEIQKKIWELRHKDGKDILMKEETTSQ